MTLATLDVALSTGQAPLVRVDRALESMRDAGHDLPSAVGEPVDNSIEAGARRIRIETFTVGVGTGSKHKASIEEIAFADNGTGISLDILPSALTLGFSTRWGQRKGLGRFGVGAKLAAISQARRVDIYTRPVGGDQVYHAHFDLDEISSGEQQFITAEEVDGFPARYVHLMSDQNGQEYESGTLVTWSKVDRLEEGGRFGTSVDERIRDLIKYLGRTYRRFLGNGCYLELNGKSITGHDPLFLTANPVAIALLGEQDWRAELFDSNKIAIDGHEVEVTVSLLPNKVRLREGEGGSGGKGEPYKPLHIPDNEGRVSILRNGREIYYDVVPRLFPGGVERIDRYIGVEVSFPAELDEYFQVRHVKRGAEPVDKLRKEIREFLQKPIRSARKAIRGTFGETKIADQRDKPEHDEAIGAFERMETTAPRGIGGADKSPEEADQILQTAAIDLGARTSQEVEDLKEQIRRQTLTVIDGDWPGKELFEIEHLNGRVIVKLNLRHPFLRDVYVPVRVLAKGQHLDLTEGELQQLARKVVGAIDLLLFSYAKAENQHPHPDEQYGQLRGYWGMFAAEGVRQLLESA
jgi:hypothetical protein